MERSFSKVRLEWDPVLYTTRGQFSWHAPHYFKRKGRHSCIFLQGPSTLRARNTRNNGEEEKSRRAKIKLFKMILKDSIWRDQRHDLAHIDNRHPILFVLANIYTKYSVAWSLLSWQKAFEFLSSDGKGRAMRVKWRCQIVSAMLYAVHPELVTSWLHWWCYFSGAPQPECSRSVIETTSGTGTVALRHLGLGKRCKSHVQN